MLGLNIEVDFVDGTKKTYPITMGVLYRFEQAHPEVMLEDFGSRVMVVPLIQLAHEAMQTQSRGSGTQIPSVDDWVDSVTVARLSAPKDK